VRTRRQRRRTALAGVAAAAVVGVVGLGSATLGGSETSRPTPSVAGEISSTPVPTPSPSVAVQPLTPQECAALEGDHLGDQRLGQMMAPALGVYAELATAHLDPQNKHLQVVGASWAGSGAELNQCPMLNLGTHLEWTSPGVDGTGQIKVSVHRDWSTVRPAHRRWQPAPFVPEGAAEAYVVEYNEPIRNDGLDDGNDEGPVIGHDTGVAVAVVRSDGSMVVVDSSNESDQDPPNGRQLDPGLSVEQLLEVAADPGFQLP
ncbi:MAG TPA: hypothetical protein PL137_20805, partial [Nocardioides sp.]|nr:hypothetical protein [Nocardioides sp.]